MGAAALQREICNLLFRHRGGGRGFGRLKLSVPNLYHAETAFVSDLRQRLRSGFLAGLVGLGGNKVCHLGRAFDVEAVHHLLQQAI
jgi:hypothetical protein